MRGERMRRRLGWPGVGLAALAVGIGIGIGRLLGERGRPGRSSRPARGPAVDSLESSSAPMESWRGSGLAEDVGVEPHGEETGLGEEARQERMREAREQLGLPDPDARDARG